MRVLTNCKNQVLYTAAIMRRISTQCFGTNKSVGVIGLGQMGGRMADNLRKHGHKLVVCDPVPANVQRQVDQGAKAAANAREVAEQCDTIITMLPSTATVECVYLGEDGVHEALRSEHLLLDSSTIDPIFTKKLSKELHDRGATFVDAPVSGGVAGAQNGTLTFMVGGEPEEFERVKPVLKAMGKNLVHCGGSSTGQIAKLCNNLALAIQMASVAEAMNLGTTLGIDPKILKNIMDTSTSSCWSTLVNHPYPGLMENVPASNNYEGGFAVGLHRKDLGLAMDCAKHAEVSIPLTCQVHQLYNMMVACGYGKKDFSYMLQYLKNGK
ncbi:3-hydroxyisobutyrate dehydrogenase [Phytophthora nicotianae INRA-310]|uniref:3-hydroxyisobutyrate dehydrogenase n=1 Tax=Phytophthora nicotianae (strain INRA-310) TaxID=761204 RepID=W2QH53_PHYN3|nr:3-hydroxyisobutyrate dehydrogenase [Phytophthora nicotianae INRA-310]ETN11615.1 3-hydroxyisobutyrate dehydrogenase [Phytophthora nicotianae INRA-310]